VVGRWNLASVSLLPSLFLKTIRENMILWFLNIRHSGTLFCGSSPWLNKYSFLSYPLKAKCVERMGKEKGYNSSHVYSKLKDGPKRTKKTFSMILERVFEMV
jgi:hypothetical protein